MVADKEYNLSICVPAYNEEGSLTAAVQDLLKTLSPSIQNLEIIIINDGSTDSTPQLAEQLAREHSQIKVIHHRKKSGIKACHQDALALAKEDYFTWFPADHENSAEQFIKCLPYLKKDVIVVFHHQGEDRRLLLRRMLSKTYTRIINKSFHLNLKYYNDLTVFPTPVIRSLPLVAKGSLFFAESIIRAIRYGCQVIELPAPLRKREKGSSKVLTFASIIRMIDDLFHIIFAYESGDS